MSTPAGQISDEEFIQLTTYRRTGAAVPTTVWVVQDGAHLLVTAPAASGKVKRLRHTQRVTMLPCSRRGKVPPGAVAVNGQAQVLTDGQTVARLSHRFATKYTLQYRIAMLVERVATRGHPHPFIVQISVDE